MLHLGRAQGFGPHRVTSLADAVAKAIAEHIGIAATSTLPGLPDIEAPSVTYVQSAVKLPLFSRKVVRSVTAVIIVNVRDKVPIKLGVDTTRLLWYT